MKYEGYPAIIFGKKRLDGKSHHSRDRYLGMILTAFRNHDRVIIEANPSTDELALSIIATLKFMGIEQEERIPTRKNIKGEEREVIIYVLDKIPILRIR